MDEKTAQRIKQLKTEIMVLRNHARNKEDMNNCWGSIGILDYLLTGDPHKILILPLRNKMPNTNFERLKGAIITSIKGEENEYHKEKNPNELWFDSVTIITSNGAIRIIGCRDCEAVSVKLEG